MADKRKQSLLTLGIDKRRVALRRPRTVSGLEELLVSVRKAVEYVTDLNRRKLFFCSQVAANDAPVRLLLWNLKCDEVIRAVQSQLRFVPVLTVSFPEINQNTLL